MLYPALPLPLSRPSPTLPSPDCSQTAWKMKSTPSKRLSTWHQKCFNCSRAHSKNYSPINYMWDYNLVKVFLRFLTQQVIGCKGHHKALEKLKSVRPQDFSDDFYQLQLGTRILEKELQNFLQENDAQNNTDMSRCSFPGGAVTGREVAAAPCIALALWCAKALGKVNRGNRGPLFPSKTPFSSPPASLRTGSGRRDESPSICTTCKILSILTSSSANHGISQVQMLTQRSWRNQMKCNHPKVHLWPCDQMTTLGHSSSYLLPALKQPQRDEVS